MSYEGNKDGRHYWLTPAEMLKALKKEFRFTMDACPFPKPDEFDGLEADWGKSTYVNPPFGSIMHKGKKKGPTAWVRKAIAEHKKGKSVVLVFPTDKWIHYLLEAGAELRSYGDVRWCATEDGKPGKGIGRFTMAFILKGKPHDSGFFVPEDFYSCRRYENYADIANAKVAPLLQALEAAKETLTYYAKNQQNPYAAENCLGVINKLLGAEK